MCEVIAPRNVHMGDYSQSHRMRSTIVETIIRDKIDLICIKDVLHIPKLYANLPSVSKLVSNSLKVQFNLKKYFVKVWNGEVIAIASLKGNLYIMDLTKVHRADVANLVQSSTEDDALKLWHRRIGNLNVKNIHKFQNMVNDMNLDKVFCRTFSLFCETCIEGKQLRDAFPNKGGGGGEDNPSSLWRLSIPTCVAQSYEDHIYERCKILCDLQ